MKRNPLDASDFSRSRDTIAMARNAVIPDPVLMSSGPWTRGAEGPYNTGIVTVAGSTVPYLKYAVPANGRILKAEKSGGHLLKARNP